MTLSTRTLYAVVPVKTLARAKTRLGPALTFAQRLNLARRFLDHTLDLLTQHPGTHRTIVVSADARALRLARSRGFIALPQTMRGGVNRAVMLGCQAAMKRSASAILVVSTDLPLLTAGALREFTRPASIPTIRIAADHHDCGTNALYIQPPRAHFAHFGDDSLRKHREMAEATGVAVEIVRERALACDVDEPADLSLSVLGR